MTTVWLVLEREEVEQPEETEHRTLSPRVTETFAEHGMPLAMLDRQKAAYVRAWLRAMLAVRIVDDDQTREEIGPLVEDCQRHPEATVRVAT
jgi:hypothetical protein